MPDDPKSPKNIKGFEAVQPRIPGVPSQYSPGIAPPTPPLAQKKAPPAAKPAPALAKKDERAPQLVMGQPVYVWAAAGGAVLLLLLIFVWWIRGSAKPAPVAAPPVDAASVTPAPAPAPAAKLPIAPGQVATKAELPNVWDSQQFMFRSSSGDMTPSLLVRLPGNNYWAISLREPYGTCRMEYVSDLAKLRNVYGLNASHPMVGDPCTKTVFDLGSYGPGPNGLVRGAVVAGAAVRPPLAIEVEVRGDGIFATRIEK